MSSLDWSAASTSELELLLEACAAGPRPERARDLAAAVEDWGRLAQAALKNRVVPLVCALLEAGAWAGVPAGARTELEGWRARFQLQNLAQVDALGEVLRACAEAGIEAVPYKGPALAEELYGDLGLREFYDLDVLVRSEDVARAEERFVALGYRRSEPEGGHADDCEAHFTRGDLLLELHWDVLPERHGGRFTAAPLFERLVPRTLAGLEVRGLGPEDLLLVLAIHGGEKHRWVRLQMLADVARLLPRVDWPLALERARAVGHEDTLLLGAFLAWVALGAELPADVLARAATGGRRTRAALALGRVERRDSGLPSRARWRRLVQDLDARARARGHDPGAAPGGASYVRAVFEPEWHDRQSVRLPNWLDFLYYAVRPLRLLTRHGIGLLRRV